MKIGGNKDSGIYIEVMSVETEEILLKELIQTKFSNISYQSTTMCWSSEVKDPDDYKYQCFQVAMFDDCLQVCQVLEYKLYYNEDEITKRLVPQESENGMGSGEFLTFLSRCLDYVTLDLVGLSLIILKKPYQRNTIRMEQNIEKDKI